MPIAVRDAIDWLPLVLVCTLLFLALPVFVIVYYSLRLSVRREHLRLRLNEADHADEYLRVYHYSEWQTLQTTDDDAKLMERFNELFTKRFRGENSMSNYLLPMVLIVTTALLFVSIIIRVHYRPAGLVAERTLVFAIAGALLYIYPQLVRRFASLSLNPQALYEAVGQLWLAALIGIVAATVVMDDLQPLTAFVGGLLPLPMIQHLRRRVDPTAADEADAARHTLLEIIGGDRELLAQLNYLGVRSVVQLAHESPLRLFVETDCSLPVCMHLVDRANLYLFFPDAGTRERLNRLGIKTAVDLMVQVYLDLPPRKNPSGEPGRRFLRPEEALPPYLREPLLAIAQALQIETIDNVRNLLQMLSEEPQLNYLLYFSAVQSSNLDKFMALEHDAEDDDADNSDPPGSEANQAAEENEPRNGGTTSQAP